ncbi:hypothetical protein M9458_009726, partial [Cirrhinus mrigala]
CPVTLATYTASQTTLVTVTGGQCSAPGAVWACPSSPDSSARWRLPYNRSLAPRAPNPAKKTAPCVKGRPLKIPEPYV